MDIVELVVVLFALQFNEDNGNQKRGQSTDKEDQEILIRGILIKSDAEDTTPDSEETDAHHHHLGQFHHEQVVAAERRFRLDHHHAL